MKKNFFISLSLLFLVNMLFVRMSCGRRTCFDPTSVSITAFDNADSTPHLPGQAGVLAKAFMLEYSLSGNSYSCDRYTIGSVIVDSMQLTSNKDFDAIHPAGNNLKDLFIIDKNYYGIESEPHRYYLINSPSDTGTHVFTIKFFVRDTLHNTSQLISSTLPVKLLL